MKPLYGTDRYLKLVLSPNYNQAPDFDVNIFTFKGGEPHIKIELNEHPTLEWRWEPIRIYHTVKSFNDLGTLFMAVNALRQHGGNNLYLSLVLPYFPGARQDRVADGVVEPLSVKVYADLINSLNLEEVIILDPHSEVAPALINNCITLTNEKFALEAAPTNSVFAIVSPDAGAAKKAEKVAKFFHSCGTGISTPGIPDIIYFKKQRDMKTGELSGCSCDPYDLKGMPCMVIDDMCDGGRTFIPIAEKLKDMGAGDIHLAVTHGIFSAGFRTLLEHFKTITTTNSWANHEMYYADGPCGYAPDHGQLKIVDFVNLYNL